MIRNYKRIVIVPLLTIFLAGCWDYTDVNRRSDILSTGVDIVDGNIEYTSEVAKLISQGGKSEEKAQITGIYKNTAEGKYFEGARAAYNSKLPLEVFLGAKRALIFSEAYAKTGIESYIKRYYNSQEFRNSALTTVCRESMKEFYSGMVENDISAGYAVEDTIKYLSDKGAALYKTVQEINSDINFGDIGYLLPYVVKNQNTIEYIGLAAMKDSKLAGVIKREDSSGFLYILSKKASTMIPVPHPKNKNNMISIKSNLSKRKIKTTFENNEVNIYIDLRFSSQLAYTYKIEPVSEEDMNKIKDKVLEKIKNDVLKALERSQNEFESDVFGFGRYFKAQNIKTYREINWKEEYLKAKFHVNVNTKITNTNLIDINAKVQE